MKKGIIIGKRQFAVAALILALGGAVWLNMKYANVSADPNSGDTSSKILGQAQYVNTPNVEQGNSSETKEDYFSQTRASRQQARDEAIELLQSTVDNVKSDEQAKKDAQAQIAKIAAAIETEASIESLIKAKGFDDAVAVLSDDDISIVVKCEDKLLASETMQIKDIVTAKTEIAADKIKILTSK